MKYSTWIIFFSLVNCVSIFSGIPTGAKKAVIVVTTLGLLFVAIVLRAVEKKQREKLEKKKSEVKEIIQPQALDDVVEVIAEDVQEQVEEELEEMVAARPASSYEHETESY